MSTVMSAVDNGSSVNQASNHHVEGAVGLTRWQKPASSQVARKPFCKEKKWSGFYFLFCWCNNWRKNNTLYRCFGIISVFIKIDAAGFFFRGFEDEFWTKPQLCLKPLSFTNSLSVLLLCVKLNPPTTSVSRHFSSFTEVFSNSFRLQKNPKISWNRIRQF